MYDIENYYQAESVKDAVRLLFPAVLTDFLPDHFRRK